jgi:predicted nucleic acid-binding protein
MLDILRVVIDTNHIMSAILSAKGASAKLIDWMTGRLFSLADFTTYLG